MQAGKHWAHKQNWSRAYTCTKVMFHQGTTRNPWASDRSREWNRGRRQIISVYVWDCGSREWTWAPLSGLTTGFATSLATGEFMTGESIAAFLFGAAYGRIGRSGRRRFSMLADVTDGEKGLVLRVGRRRYADKGNKKGNTWRPRARTFFQIKEIHETNKQKGKRYRPSITICSEFMHAFVKKENDHKANHVKCI